MQQRGGLQNERGARDACPADEQSAQTGDDPIPGLQVRRAFTAAIQDQKLMPDQDRFRDHAAKLAGPGQPHDSDDQMKQKNEEVAHPDNRNKARQPSDFTPTLEFAMDPPSIPALASFRRLRNASYLFSTVFSSI